MASLPSGEQYRLTYGDQSATIVEVGGGIRDFHCGDREVLTPYGSTEICPAAQGTVLIPWPNRLDSGRYEFAGVDHQLAITEPTRSNAIHGLLRWRAWEPTFHDTSSVTMTTTIHPMDGYPFAVEVAIAYSLDDEGLTVTTTATNTGATAAPFGAGQHPYLSPGVGSIDSCDLEVAASTRILSDPIRQLPTGQEQVCGSPFDFHKPRRLGALELDDAFTDLERDEAGRVWVRLTGIDGRTVQLWADENYPYVQIYTGEGLPEGRRRSGLAVEPMTCPANAFRSGVSLRTLQPAESTTMSWGVALS